MSGFQAEAQKKKDEAEVQVNLYTHGSHRSRNKGSQRPGMLVQIVDYTCLISRTSQWIWNICGHSDRLDHL